MIRYLLATLALGLSGSLMACSDSDGGETLEIVRLEHNGLVFMNGDRLPLTIHWAGEAEFPVTVSLSVPDGECPQDVICHNEEHEIEDAANPLVVPEALWCTGQGAAFSAPWDVTIKGANGIESEPAQMAYTCRS